MSTTYTLRRSRFGLTSHYLQKIRLLCDTDRYEELRIHVKSGDYFAQLATILDTIQDLQDSDQDMSKALHRVIQDLIYLQAHYEIHPAQRTLP